MNVLLDENCAPRVRDVIGSLLTQAETAVFAVSNIRLAALDLAAAEVRNVKSCRILIRRLEYGQLSGLPRGREGADISALRGFICSDRVEVRSAGIGGWNPDFSVFTGSMGAVCMIGAHYFQQPPEAHGPSFTCVLHDAHAAARAQRRFEALWESAHDVRDAVIAALDSCASSFDP